MTGMVSNATPFIDTAHLARQENNYVSEQTGEACYDNLQEPGLVGYLRA